MAHGCSYFPASLSVQSTFPATASRVLKYGRPNDKINFFEQNAPGRKTVRPIDAEAENRADAEEVKNELAKLDHELRIWGPLRPNRTFMKELSEVDRAIALEGLWKYETENGP